ATLTGYRAHPAGMNLIAYAVYWAVIFLLLRRSKNRMEQKASRKTANRAA
ncbi:MAG: FTR1 family iron permease, partial [Caballeronia sp.]